MHMYMHLNIYVLVRIVSQFTKAKRKQKLLSLQFNFTIHIKPNEVNHDVQNVSVCVETKVLFPFISE